MGHKTLTTTERYVHHCLESLRNRITALEAFRSERVKDVSQFYHSEGKIKAGSLSYSVDNLLKKLVPEVGIEPTWGGSPAGF
jgi:hypothetical protein